MCVARLHVNIHICIDRLDSISIHVMMIIYNIYSIPWSPFLIFLFVLFVPNNIKADVIFHRAEIISENATHHQSGRWSPSFWPLAEELGVNANLRSFLTAFFLHPDQFAMITNECVG